MFKKLSLIFLSFLSLHAEEMAQECLPECEPYCPCVEPRSSFEVHGGFRWDKLQNTVGIVVPNNFKMSNDVLVAKNLAIWEIGGIGEIAIDANWFIKGYYYYGWITGGHFSNEEIRGKERGNTKDAQGGIGFVYPLFYRWALAPQVGWAFNQQKTILHDASPPEFEKLRFLSMWNGPWIGIDFIYERNCFTLSGGYEFHLTDWRGSWVLHKALSDAFSDKRKVGTAYGHVIHLNGSWDFAMHWDLNLELKYQNWQTRGIGNLNSKEEALFTSSLGSAVTLVNFVQKVFWHSWGAALNLGYHF